MWNKPVDTVPATEDVAVQVRTPFKKKYFISGLTSKLNISNYSSLKNNEFQFKEYVKTTFW